MESSRAVFQSGNFSPVRVFLVANHNYLSRKAALKSILAPTGAKIFYGQVDGQTNESGAMDLQDAVDSACARAQNHMPWRNYV